MEVKDVIISIAIPLLAAFMSYAGSRRGTKVAKEDLENRKEATPPELLRLEKWSMILKDLESYPKEFKDELEMETIYSTYNDILARATLENRVVKLGILSAEIRENLCLIRPYSGGIYYPKPSWNNVILKNWKLNIIIGAGMVVNILLYISGAILGYVSWWVSMTVITLFLMVCYIIFFVEKDNKKQKNIIFRNGYHALKDIYLINPYGDLIEADREDIEREKFEKGKAYDFWYKRNKKDHPEWRTSWNYGLSISWDNNPDKAKTGESAPETPTDLAGSESTPEDPKRQEP